MDELYLSSLLVLFGISIRHLPYYSTGFHKHLRKNGPYLYRPVMHAKMLLDKIWMC